ncbi:MAG TPA: SpoIID/LytB domain-containing protein [Herpetosiphonaceae bacterium]
MRVVHFLRSLAARRLSYLLLLVALLGSGVGSFAARVEAQAAARNSAIVTGWVHDAKTGQGLGGAIVHVGSTILTTDDQGNLPRTSLPLSGSTMTTDIEVVATQYPTWRYSGLNLAAGQTVELHIELSDQQPVQPQPKPVAPRPVSIFDGPPEFIDVGRTFGTDCVFPPTNVQRVDRMPFIDYVRNVLPNEWVDTWPEASLDAGAVAVTQYAWSEAFVKQKWRTQGYSFDVVDSTCDQVYKDRDTSKDYTRTDAAVARMWGTILTRGSSLITTYYRAKDSQCGSKDCMGQWGTYNLANKGYSGLQILFYYYGGASGNLSAYATAPKHRGLILQRSADITVWPGRSQTLSVKMRNTGTATWQKNATQLVVVDPQAADPTPIDSPLVNESWLNPQQPATLLQTKAVIGMDGTWSFIVTAPEGLAPGRYQIAVQPRAEDGSWIDTNTRIVWNVTVTAPLEPAVWIPGARSAP